MPSFSLLLGLAAHFADRFLLMYAGTMIAVGEPLSGFDDKKTAIIDGVKIRRFESDGQKMFPPWAVP